MQIGRPEIVTEVCMDLSYRPSTLLHILVIILRELVL